MSGISRQNNSEKLIPNIIDEIAQKQPQKLFAQIPNDANSLDQGFRDITYHDLANAINGMAHWIDNNLGRKQNFETLVYFGPHDPRYVILLISAVKTGRKMLFPSPRFATSAVVHLIKSVEGKTMLLSRGAAPPTVTSTLESYPMEQYQIPDLYELLTQTHSQYTFNRSFADARNDPLVVLHTSGSTGKPKPIIWTHDWADSYATEFLLDPPDGCESMIAHLRGARVLAFFPQFHAGHLFFCLFATVFSGTVAVFPLSGQPPSIDMALKTARKTELDTISLGPSLVEELCSNDALLDELKQRVHRLNWAGSDVSDNIGSRVNARIPLSPLMGSTEMGLWPTIRGKECDNDWHYLGTHPGQNLTMEWREGKTYEAVMKRNETGYIQPVFRVFPDLTQYPTGDLFTQHPDKPSLWKYYGRADDMLVFRSGIKYHPVASEQFLVQHPEIENALMVGGLAGPEATLIVKLAPGVNLDQIWHIILAMNKNCPADARIGKGRVLILGDDDVFVRTAKGNVQRRAMFDRYQKSLEALFEKPQGLVEE